MTTVESVEARSAAPARLSVASPPRRTVGRALTWLLLPWWALQVFSGRKSFVGNPVLGSAALNRRGLHVWRARLAGRLAERRRALLARRVEPADLAAFARDGFVARRGALGPERLDRLRAEVAAYEAPGFEFREGDAVTRRIPLTPRALRAMPAVAELLRQPPWRGLTRYVSSFDAEPMVYIQTVFAGAEEAAAADPQTALHMDTFHPVMKAWLYLDDITDAVGPLVYAPGTHRRTPRREAWERARSVTACTTAAKGGAFRVTEAELPRLGARGVHRFDVPAGTLIVADTSGFHARAKSPHASMRVEIYASSRRRPFFPWTRPGLEDLPWIGPRLGELADALESRGLRRRKFGAPSRRVARTSAYAPPEPWPG